MLRTLILYSFITLILKTMKSLGKLLGMDYKTAFSMLWLQWGKWIGWGGWELAWSRSRKTS